MWQRPCCSLGCFWAACGTEGLEPEAWMAVVVSGPLVHCRIPVELTFLLENTSVFILRQAISRPIYHYWWEIMWEQIWFQQNRYFGQTQIHSFRSIWCLLSMPQFQKSHSQWYLGAFNDPIFLFSSAMMLSSVPTSASHWASSAGEGSKFAVWSVPSRSRAMWSIASPSHPDPASRLSHLTRLECCRNRKLYLDCKKISWWLFES